jgi:hypothetical protein
VIKVKTDAMDVACDTCGREETYTKYKGMGPLGRPSHRWEDKSKMDLKK